MDESGFAVRMPAPHEARGARMLCPQAYGNRTPPIAFVAVTGNPAQVVASLAMNPWPQGHVRGFVVWVRVAAPFRRRGIARALVNAAAAEARARGVKALYASDPLESGSPDLPICRALGMTESITVNHYQAASERVVDVVRPLALELRSRGWIPTDAEVVGMKEVPDQTLAQMHVTLLGGVMPVILARLRGAAPESFAPALSYGLRRGGDVIGALLGRAIEPGVAFVDAIIIRPEYRMGWAHLMLKLHAAERAVALGFRELRFTAYDNHKDTRKMASKSGATLVKQTVIPYRLV